MREILFIGKRTDNEQWVYGGYHNPFEGMYQIIHETKQNLSSITEVNYKTIGQYTGLKDKNGKKIFEGDKFILNNKEMHVEYVADFCCYILTTGNGYDSHNSRSLDCDIVYYEEIIGNIHDN